MGGRSGDDNTVLWLALIIGTILIVICIIILGDMFRGMLHNIMATPTPMLPQ